jgi:hypothetical protein
MLEGFKLNFRGFDILGYLRSLDASKDSTYNSIIMTFLNESLDIANVSDAVDAYVDSDEIWKKLFLALKPLVRGIEEVSKIFFGNFIAEEDLPAVVGGAGYSLESLFTPQHRGGSYENAYLKNIKYRGVPPEFAREMSSVGFGINRRKEILDIQRGSDYTKMLAILSSNAYVDVFDKSSLLSAPDAKVATYNIIDLMRGIRRDMDLFFSVDMLEESKSDKLYDVFKKSLQIEAEISFIGNNAFVENINRYKNEMNKYVDRGALYSKNVKSSQQYFSTFSTRALINAGKVWDKVSGRLMKVFI